MKSQVLSIAASVALMLAGSVPSAIASTRLVERTTVVAASNQVEAEKKCLAFAAKHKNLTFREVFQLTVRNSWECSYLYRVEVVYPKRKSAPKQSLWEVANSR